MLSFSFGFGLPLTSQSITEVGWVPQSKAKRENVPPQKETPNQSLKKESVKRALMSTKTLKVHFRHF